MSKELWNRALEKAKKKKCSDEVEFHKLTREIYIELCDDAAEDMAKRHAYDKEEREKLKWKYFEELIENV